MGTKKKAYEKGDIVRFSNSTLGTFEDCAFCFYIEQRYGAKWPRGVFPSLPGGMDRVLKIYFDKHMSLGTLPPEMAELEGATPYPDRVKMEQWRNWRNLIIDIDGIAQLSGALDDLIVWPDGLCSPYDYKTRGAAPKDGASEDYYGTQLDIYHLLVEKGCGLKCNGDGYLLYLWPDEAVGSGKVQFNTQTVKLQTDPARAIKLVHDAVECLETDMPPQPSETCERCQHVTRRGEIGNVAL